jgi:DNA polymerase I-like protein with 3'-5' exonuclease and polymerase domains
VKTPLKPCTLLAVKTRDGLDDVLARLRHGPLAVDTETTGLAWWHERVGSINLAAGNTAICAYGEALAPVARYLASQVKRERTLIFHNAKFDLHHLRETFGLHVPYLVHDTAVESFVIDNRGANAYRWWTKKAHSLKSLAQVYIDPDASDHEKAMMSAIRRRGGKTKGDWLVLIGTEDEHLFSRYSALDSWYTLQLHDLFWERIAYWVQPEAPKGERPYPSLLSVYVREQWLIRAFLDMEARGIQADRAFLEEWRDQLAKELDAHRRKLWALAGKREINWNSNPQLVDLLYNKLRIASPVRNTQGVTMLNLPHAIGPAIVKYRETFKQWSSYATSLLDALTSDGTIHATFRSTGADTGRTSCADPNLQQQTRISGVRKAYRPRKGLAFRFADYSQVEMRFASHFAHEASLIAGFLEDPDFDTHKQTAMNMFGKMFDPNSQHRKFGKIINFTKLFGGGENKITEQLVSMVEEDEARAGCRALRLTIEPGINAWRTLARGIVKAFNASMPGFANVIRAEAEAAERRGYMMNAFGGHRFFNEGDDRWYAAFNTRVQGTAGMQAKEGLVRVYRECQLNRGELACLLLIHDEIVYESAGDPRTDRRVLKLMEDRDGYRVPIIADMKAGPKNWQDKVSVKL